MSKLAVYKNDMDLNEKLAKIERGLQVWDWEQKNLVCDEAMGLLDSGQDGDFVYHIANLLVPHLLDLSRYKDAMKCIETMLESTNTVVQGSAHIAEVEYYKKVSNQEGLKTAIDKTRAFAEKQGEEQMLIYVNKEMGKALINECKYEEAIRHFIDMEIISEKNQRKEMVALSKYYVAICLYHLGHALMANEKLREATEIAFFVKNPQIAMHSEMMRALCLMELGMMEESKAILEACYSNFSKLL